MTLDDHERDQWDTYFFAESVQIKSIHQLIINSDGQSDQPGWCWDATYITRVENDQAIRSWGWTRASGWIYGGTYYFGGASDVGTRTNPPGFIQPYYDADGHTLLSNASGTRDLLFICIDPMNGWPLADINGVHQLTNMVQRWFAENSQSRFRIGSVFVRGCGGDTGTYQAPSNHRQNNYYWTAPTGHHDAYVDAIRAADSTFDFGAYDTNRDKKLTGGELAVAILRPNGPQWGDRAFALRTATVRVDGVSSIAIIDLLYEPAPHDNTSQVGLLAHEMMHQLLGAEDMYDNAYEVPDLPFDADLYSIMDQHGGATHLDPFHKLKYGWLEPTVYVLDDTSFVLLDVETTGNAAILYDPSWGATEYFIVENRVRGSSFDVSLPDEGVLVWHIIEDHNLAIASSVPEAIGHSWGRYAIRLLTPTPLKATRDGAAGQILDAGFKVRVNAQQGSTVAVEVERLARDGYSLSFAGYGTGAWQYLGPFDVPDGGSLKIIMTADTSDADLYVRRDDYPTAQEFDCASTSSGSDETCLMRQGGRYYVGVYAYSDTPNVRLTVNY
ncbi:MAG TPA: PPC domain-containing protein [Candidatus Tectomicrobia bacterium]